MRNMLVGGDWMIITSLAMKTLSNFCENQLNCGFCPFHDKEFACKLENEKGEVPELWEEEDDDDLERMD